MAEEIGTAVIAVRAPLDKVRADLNQLDAMVRKLLGNVAELKIDADATAAMAEINSVTTEVRDIPDGDVTIDGDAAAALAAVDSIETSLAGIQDETVHIMGDPADALGAVGQVGAELAGLNDESVLINADAGQALGNIQTVEASLAGIDDQDVRVTADTREAQGNVQSLEAALAGLEDQTVRVTTETQNAGTAAMGFGSRVGGAVANVGALKAGVAGLAGGAAAGGFYKLGQGALELRDTVNATNVVFGDSRRIIDDWAQNSVDRVGLSERAFRDLSAPLGALMRSLGATGSEVANMSTEVISLGADFASVLGGSTEEAVMAIGAAFRGETEPIRRYGITLDAAAVQERALAMGLVDSTGKIQNRAAVVRDLIVEQAEANGIVGDFNRTQGEGVNALREADAALEDAKNAWGELFAPAVEAGANALRQAAEASEYIIGPLQTVHGWLDKIDLVDMGDVTGALRTVGEWVGIVGDDTEAAAAQTRMHSEAQRDAAAASREGADGLGRYYNSLRTAEEAQRMNSEAQRDAAWATRSYADEAEVAEQATSALKTALDDLIGVNLSAESASVRFEESLLSVTSTLRDNSHHLVGNSEATLRSRGAVVSAAEAALRHVEALKEQGANTATVSMALETHRLGLVNAMVAGGMARAEAEAYVGTLGFTKQNLDNVAVALGAETVQLDTAAGATANAKARTDEFKGSLDRSAGAASTARDRVFDFEGAVRAVPGSKDVHIRTPGLHEAHVSLDSFKAKIDALKGGEVNFSLKLTQEHIGRPMNDGPGAPIGGGGPALARAQAAMSGIPGLRVTSTYRSPAENRRVGGAPNSYHLDRSNPAVDVGGPTSSLDRYAARLRAMGGWREGPIWRAPGHYDHVHVAHDGGMVSNWWPTMPGLGADERPAILQLGEVVIPKMHTGGVVGSPMLDPSSFVNRRVGAGFTNRPVRSSGPMLNPSDFVNRRVRAAEKCSEVHNHFYGSVITERDLNRTLAGQQGRRNYTAGRR